MDSFSSILEFIEFSRLLFNNSMEKKFNYNEV
jgi:hypothetical protein